MKRITYILALSLLPVSAAAQQDPTERLTEVLPPEVSAQVIERIEAARARELPVQSAANLALEGVAKGRGAEEVLAAVELLVGDMGRVGLPCTRRAHRLGHGLAHEVPSLKMGKCC